MDTIYKNVHTNRVRASLPIATVDFQPQYVNTGTVDLISSVMATSTLAQEALQGEADSVRKEEITSSSKVQVLKHTEVLNGEARDVWEACKHAVALLPDLAPEYFAKAEFEKGSGAPGSVGVFHFGPGTDIKIYALNSHNIKFL